MDEQRGTRDQLLRVLADSVPSSSRRPVRVALDGPPASGKTTLADELAAVLRSRGRTVVRASIDHFLRPAAQRYRRGEYSAEGCYSDAHDLDLLIQFLLDPLGPGGDRQVRGAGRTAPTDAELSPDPTTAPEDAVLLFDGVFLLRPELVDRWELTILVSITPAEAVRRAVVRDSRMSSAAAVERRWRERYLPAQQLYFALVRPTDLADVVVHNDQPDAPHWGARRWR